MQDSAVKEEEVQIPEEVKGQITEQPQKLEEQKIISPAAVSQADLASEDKVPDMQHKTKPSSSVKPKKTRKRGRRKIGSSKQNRKATR